MITKTNISNILLFLFFIILFTIAVADLWGLVITKIFGGN